MNHHCYKPSQKDSDFIRGVNSPIPFKSLISSGDWTTHNQYFERQKFTWDTEGCVIFAAQEAIDAQMDELISQGQIDSNLLSLFNQMGFMDTNSLDQKAHFHSSPRYLQSLTGNGYNGNALTDPFDAARKYGIIPWASLPFDISITQEEYLLPTMPQNLLDLGKQFLAAVGGQNWIEYHWITKDATDTQAMDVARQQAPLVIAVLAEAPGWNQYEPPIPYGPPCHGVQNYNSLPAGELILDHYDPFEKLLQTGYPIPQVLQGVVTVTPPPPAPLPPEQNIPINPTPFELTAWQAFLASLNNWLIKIQNGFGKVVKKIQK